MFTFHWNDTESTVQPLITGDAQRKASLIGVYGLYRVFDVSEEALTGRTEVMADKKAEGQTSPVNFLFHPTRVVPISVQDFKRNPKFEVIETPLYFQAELIYK